MTSDRRRCWRLKAPRTANFPVRHIWVPQRMRPSSLAPQELEKRQSKSYAYILRRAATAAKGSDNHQRAHSDVVR